MTFVVCPFLLLCWHSTEPPGVNPRWTLYEETRNISSLSLQCQNLVQENKHPTCCSTEMLVKFCHVSLTDYREFSFCVSVYNPSVVLDQSRWARLCGSNNPQISMTYNNYIDTGLAGKLCSYLSLVAQVNSVATLSTITTSMSQWRRSSKGLAWVIIYPQTGTCHCCLQLISKKPHKGARKNSARCSENGTTGCIWQIRLMAIITISFPTIPYTCKNVGTYK